MNPVYTTPRWIRWSTACLAVLFTLVAALAWWWQGWSLLSLAPSGLALVSSAVWIQTLMARVELAPQCLVFTRRYRSQRVAVDSIDRVELYNGAPPALRLDDQRIVYLPEVGESKQALVNAIERWLEQPQHKPARQSDTKKPD